MTTMHPIFPRSKPQHRLLFVALLTALPCLAQEDTALKQDVVARMEKAGVELRLDLPYADNTNPRQMVDLYLPKKRNNDKPLPVIAFIHGDADRAVPYEQSERFVATLAEHKVPHQLVTRKNASHNWPEMSRDEQG